jgi:hypothetical protein
MGNQSVFEHGTTQGDIANGKDGGIAMRRLPPSEVQKLLYTTASSG